MTRLKCESCGAIRDEHGNDLSETKKLENSQDNSVEFIDRIMRNRHELLMTAREYFRALEIIQEWANDGKILDISGLSARLKENTERHNQS